MKINFNPRPFLDKAQVIENTVELERFFEEIKTADRIAVDIESAGFYKYYARVNLIQIATRERCAIFDPQKIKDFEPFQRFVSSSDCIWVFHGGDYDIAMLARDLDVYIPRMFDTRKAAEFVGIKELGLSSLTSRFLGFVLDKKLQRCDWSRRPLTDEMKDYALLDAVCLIPLHRKLEEMLVDLGRYDWAMEECEAIARAARESKGPAPKPHAYRIKGASRFSLRSLAVLRELWKFREKIAARIDRAPFMLLSNQAMLEIARQMPRSYAGLSVIRSINREFLARYGNDLKEAVKVGLEADLGEIEKSHKTRGKAGLLTPWEGELAKSLKDVRARVARKMGLTASLLAPTPMIYELARLRPKSPGELQQSELLHDWQVKLIADDFLPLLTQEPPTKDGKSRRRRRNRKNK